MMSVFSDRVRAKPCFTLLDPQSSAYDTCVKPSVVMSFAFCGTSGGGDSILFQPWASFRKKYPKLVLSRLVSRH